MSDCIFSKTGRVPYPEQSVTRQAELRKGLDQQAKDLNKQSKDFKNQVKDFNNQAKDFHMIVYQVYDLHNAANEAR